MRRKQPHSCGLGPAFNVIGGKWKALILWEVHIKPRRFGELKRLVPGISEKMLIQQLRQMEEDGLLAREDFGEIPPRVEYTVTQLGTSLATALTPVGRWGEEHGAEIEERWRRREQETMSASR
ncbi:winged helix-turn-helix transcriptional regulator [Aminobacter sp. LjRoot7]|uniref:winged helix-turn-helix transcriptional regulator n=1 Tax=Aminobacter sp. LjRoot7 TaxID=3342335 RepID=UPI003ECFD221